MCVNIYILSKFRICVDFFFVNFNVRLVVMVLMLDACTFVAFYSSV